MRPRLLHSDALASLSIPHAFTTRHGGFSVGPFSTLNFGNPGDLPRDQRDPASNIRANLDLVTTALNARHCEVVEVHQVHAGDVHTVPAGRPAHPTPNDTKADALVTNDPGRLIAIRVADCVPVLLASLDGSVVAAAHAGWRGVIADVVPHTVAAMLKLGTPDPSSIVASIGPCIGPTAFEVGPEVAEAFRARFGAQTPHVRPTPAKTPAGNPAQTQASEAGKFLVDLKSALCAQLVESGVPIVDVLPHCTVTTLDPETNLPLFFSHRRDRGHTGRMIGIIGPRAPIPGA